MLSNKHLIRRNGRFDLLFGSQNQESQAIAKEEVRRVQLAGDPVCPKGFKSAEFVLLDIRCYEEDGFSFFLTVSCRQVSASGQGFGG